MYPCCGTTGLASTFPTGILSAGPSTTKLDPIVTFPTSVLAPVTLSDPIDTVPASTLAPVTTSPPVVMVWAVILPSVTLLITAFETVALVTVALVMPALVVTVSPNVPFVMFAFVM